MNASKVTIRPGQKWREIDRRFPSMPVREVVGIASDGRVLLKRADGGVAKCNPARFHGRNGGYGLVEDVPMPTDPAAPCPQNDPRANAVKNHFNEWHGVAPDSYEIEALLARIDAINAHAVSAATAAIEAAQAAFDRGLEAGRAEGEYLAHAVPDDATVERVARAIAEDDGCTDLSWEISEPIYKAGYRSYARAAIAAMRGE